MLRRSQKPTVNTFTSLIDAAGKVNNHKHAIRLLQLAIQSNVRPNVCTFTSLMTACMAVPDFDAGLSTLKQMSSYVQSGHAPLEYLVPYNAFLMRAGKAGEVDKMMSALDEMIEKARLQPPPSTFEFVLDRCAAAGAAGAAWHAFGKLLLLWGEAAPAALADMARVCVHVGTASSLTAAAGFAQQIVDRGVMPSPILINALLVAAARMGVVEPTLPRHALGFLCSLLSHGGLPDDATARVLIDTGVHLGLGSPTSGI